MKRFINVHTGEIMAGREDITLNSDTNSACMVIVAYDAIKKIGGLAHAMFLSNGKNKKNKFTLMTDASGAIDEMMDDMTGLGAEKENIKICLVSGENVRHEKNDPEYNKNIQDVMDVLKEKKIRFSEQIATDVGKLHISFDVESGAIKYH